MSRRFGKSVFGGVPGAPGVAPRARTLQIGIRTNAVGIVAAVGFCAYRLATVGLDVDAWFAAGVAVYFAIACGVNVLAARRLARGA